MREKTLLLLKPYCTFSDYTVPNPTPILLFFLCETGKLTLDFCGGGHFSFSSIHPTFLGWSPAK